MVDSAAELSKYHHFGYGELASKHGIADRLRREIAPLRFKNAANAVTKEIGIKPDDKVLEIGCGIGLLGEAIKSKIGAGLTYYGMDLNFDPAFPKTGEKRPTPIQANATNLPFPDRTFDKIVSTDVFEHINDATILVRETYRVLKPGGKAFIVIADPSEGRFFVRKDHIKRGETESDVSFWTEMFTSAGFKISETSEKYRKGDLRRVFNLPMLRKVKDKPYFSCALRIVNRPGVYILEKQEPVGIN